MRLYSFILFFFCSASFAYPTCASVGIEEPEDLFHLLRVRVCKTVVETDYAHVKHCENSASSGGLIVEVRRSGTTYEVAYHSDITSKRVFFLGCEM